MLLKYILVYYIDWDKFIDVDGIFLVYYSIFYEIMIIIWLYRIYSFVEYYDCGIKR